MKGQFLTKPVDKTFEWFFSKYPKYPITTNRKKQHTSLSDVVESLYGYSYSQLETGCIIYGRSKDKDGYGWVYVGRTSPSGHPFSEKAHRIALTLKLERDILDGFLACHTCDNPSCINPAHLYEGTQFDNERDKSVRGRHKNLQKTHCKNGHEFNEKNTWIRSDGSRNCRICKRDAQKRSVLKKRATS